MKSSSEAIPLDTLAEFIILTNLKLLNEKKDNIREIFEACDLNGNGDLEIGEIKIIFKLFD